MKPRNYLVRLAKFRKAGAHIKTNKAKRRKMKQNKEYLKELYFI